MPFWKLTLMLNAKLLQRDFRIRNPFAVPLASLNSVLVAVERCRRMMETFQLQYSEKRLNRVLDAAGFDAFVEEQCTKFYTDGVGRPSLAPGRYFRMLLLGYFEGLDSNRAIAWRAADSLSLRQFLDVSLDAAPPEVEDAHEA